MHFTIDKSLAHENATDRGFIYAGDFLFDDQHPERLTQTFRYGFEHGCIAGQPHPSSQTKNWEKGQVFGFYIPYKENLLLTPILDVDYSLTPENAQVRGYWWEEDISYNPQKGFYSNMNVITSVWDMNCVLGASKSRDPKIVGVYLEREDYMPPRQSDDIAPTGKPYFIGNKEKIEPVLLKRTKKN